MLLSRVLATVFGLSAVTHAGGIYWTNRGDSMVEKSRYDGVGRTTVLASAGTNVRGIALDLANNRLYYADNGADILYRMNMDGSGRITVLATGPNSFPADVRPHFAAGHLYYCDQQKAHLRRINLDGTSPAALVTDSVYQPYYLDLDLTAGKIYWGDFDGTSAGTGNVFRCNLDGTGRETIVTNTQETRAVCVDAPHGMLYWVNRNAGRIQRCLLSALPVNAATSPAVQTIYSNLDTPHGMVLDPFAGKVYWVDTATLGTPGTLGDKAVSRGDMDGSGPHEVLVELGSEPWDIDIDPRCLSYAEWVARFFTKSPGAAAVAGSDPDKDGLPNTTEYTLGLHPLRCDTELLPSVIVWTDPSSQKRYPALNYTRRSGASDVTASPQLSMDLTIWWDAELSDSVPQMTLVSATDIGEGIQRIIMRSVHSFDEQPRQFTRVRTALAQ